MPCHQKKSASIDQRRAAALEAAGMKEKAERRNIRAAKRAKRATMAKQPDPLKVVTTRKNLQSPEPAASSRIRELEDDDEEIVFKSDPLHNAGNSHQANSGSASTPTSSISDSASASRVRGTTRPALLRQSTLRLLDAQSRRPGTDQRMMSLNISTFTDTQQSDQIVRPGHQSKDKRRMALMLELKRTEAERKQVELLQLEMQQKVKELELRELEMQQKIMELEYED